MNQKVNLPTSKNLVFPIIQVLQSASGPLMKSEIDNALKSNLMLSEAQLSIPHDKSRAEYQYRSAWALTYGKKSGYLENLSRNQWVISAKGKQVLRESDVIL